MPSSKRSPKIISARAFSARAFSARAFSARAFTLVEIMIVVLIIGILLAIAVPSFVSARETSRTKCCVANLSQINSAKMQCAIDNKLSDASAATFSIDGVTPTTTGVNGVYQLAGALCYIRRMPVCPSGGVYTPGTVSAVPLCSIPADNLGAANYQPGGKWFHGY